MYNEHNEFTLDEKKQILTFYKNCKDMSLKLILRKLLLNAGILIIKSSR